MTKRKNVGAEEEEDWSDPRVWLSPPFRYSTVSDLSSIFHCFRKTTERLHCIQKSSNQEPENEAVERRRSRVLDQLKSKQRDNELKISRIITAWIYDAAIATKYLNGLTRRRSVCVWCRWRRSCTASRPWQRRFCSKCFTLSPGWSTIRYTPGTTQTPSFQEIAEVSPSRCLESLYIK